MCEVKIIDGEVFKKLMLGGASNLQVNVQEVNELNVFPIPDGDTGENMYLTLKGGMDALQAKGSASLQDGANAFRYLWKG